MLRKLRVHRVLVAAPRTTTHKGFADGKERLFCLGNSAVLGGYAENGRNMSKRLRVTATPIYANEQSHHRRRVALQRHFVVHDSLITVVKP